MEYFRFTLFNCITLLVMALTVLMAVMRWRTDPRSGWPSVYYAVIAGYTIGFDGSLNKVCVLAGILSAALIRSGRANRVRWAEATFFAYVLWRAVGLLLLW